MSLLLTNGTIIHKSEFLAAKPSFLPTIEITPALFFFANSIAFIIFVLTFFDLLPPPTERIKIISFEFKFETFNQFVKLLSQPESLTFAENSDTLSVGVYVSIEHNFLKSFTA